MPTVGNRVALEIVEDKPVVAGLVNQDRAPLSPEHDAKENLAIRPSMPIHGAAVSAVLPALPKAEPKRPSPDLDS